MRERRLVRDIMTVDVEVLRPTDTAAAAARCMRDLNVGVVPVCEGDRLVGLVTDRDITVRVTADGQDPKTVPLQDIFSSDDLATAEPDWNVDKAAEVMARHQIRRLPVIDQGILVGMVSLGDLAVRTGQMEPAAKTLKEISQPAAPGPSRKAIA